MSWLVDDHACNHAAIGAGRRLSLAPAYGIFPENRTGEEASQGTLIHDDVRVTRLSACTAAAPHFHLSDAEAVAVIEGAGAHGWRKLAVFVQAGTVRKHRSPLFPGRAVPFTFHGLPVAAKGLAALADG